MQKGRIRAPEDNEASKAMEPAQLPKNKGVKRGMVLISRCGGVDSASIKQEQCFGKTHATLQHNLPELDKRRAITLGSHQVVVHVHCCLHGRGCQGGLPPANTNAYLADLLLSNGNHAHRFYGGHVRFQVWWRLGHHNLIHLQD